MGTMPTNGLSEFDRYRRHDTFIVIKDGKPFCGRSLNLVVAHKSKVSAAPGTPTRS